MVRIDWAKVTAFFGGAIFCCIFWYMVFRILDLAVWRR